MKNIVIGSGPAGRLGSLELGKLGEEVHCPNVIKHTLLIMNQLVYIMV